jgi:hypothetical protein
MMTSSICLKPTLVKCPQSKSPFASAYLAGDEGHSKASDNVRYTNTEKARLYDELFRDQYKQEKEKKYSSYTIPTFQNKWGLQISPAICSEQELNVVKVILCKQDRGNDPIARKKTKDTVVKALAMKISAGNLSRLLTSVAANEYNVAEDAISWQTILDSIHTFVLQYDMTSIIMIPQDVDLLHPHLVVKANKFKNAIVNWQDLQDANYFEWQEFVLQNSTEVVIESDNWLDEVLTLSMDNILRAEVESDIINVPKHQRGAITTLCCIIKCMVVRNQEARDALGNYIREFDITKFPGENVPIACLCLKAVACALGTRDLPTNTIRRILEGFGKSSTTSLIEFCASQIFLRRGSFYEKIMQSSSLQMQLNEVLNDLEATYLALVGGKLWAGVNASPMRAAFVGDKNIDDEITEAMALALKTRLPFVEWEKMNAVCHKCGKKEHIRPNCRIYLEKIKSGQVRPPFKKGGPRKPPLGPPKSRRDFSTDPKAKAFWVTAFNAMFGEDDENETQDVPCAEEIVAAGNTNDDEDEEMRSFLSMAGPLKE